LHFATSKKADGKSWRATILALRVHRTVRCDALFGVVNRTRGIGFTAKFDEWPLHSLKRRRSGSKLEMERAMGIENAADGHSLLKS
jgi:hypothetical protein